jgi:ribose-phosphate pyrophosphokinase
MFKINNIPVQIERYPDATPRLNIAVDEDEVVLTWLYESGEEMLLLFITRHVREKYGVKNITLYMPYIPHARMDRVKKKDEVFTLKYFCEFINSLCFDRVVVRDAHSSVSLALLNNVVLEPIGNTIKKLATSLLDIRKDIVFYPDEGSSKRYSGTIEFPYAFGVKKRDWNTGKIKSLDVQGDVPAPPFHALIIDDISSYGGTFLHSARKLKELGADKVYLYVTHCENTILKGELINSGLLERIYTTKSIYTEEHPLINYIDNV